MSSHRSWFVCWSQTALYRPLWITTWQLIYDPHMDYELAGHIEANLHMDYELTCIWITNWPVCGLRADLFVKNELTPMWITSWPVRGIRADPYVDFELTQVACMWDAGHSSHWSGCSVDGTPVYSGIPWRSRMYAACLWSSAPSPIS